KCRDTFRVSPTTAAPRKATTAPPAIEEDEDNAKCPSCGERMESGAVLCVACGFNRKTGKVAEISGSLKRKKKRHERNQKALVSAYLYLLALTAGELIIGPLSTAAIRVFNVQGDYNGLPIALLMPLVGCGLFFG